MGGMNAEQFGRICDDVWRDRAGIISRRGLLTDEAALIRAVYWRICKAGGVPDRNLGAYATLLDRLVRQCRDEARGVEKLSANNDM